MSDATPPTENTARLEKKLKILTRKLERSELSSEDLEDLVERELSLHRQLRVEVEAARREMKIEAALERVRAHTMAMRKSEELPQAANVLFQQIQSLGMPAWSAGYCIWDDDKQAITLWMSSEGVLQPPFKAPMTEDPSFVHMRDAHERGETFFVEEVGGEALVTHYEYMRTLPVVGEILDSIIEAGHPLPTFQIFHVAYFTHGFLLFITYEPVPEAHEIFKRFARVFEQTYTRFLDLKKAEAQAREAQIEVALERVRAKSMAMHKSEELAALSLELVMEVQALGVATWHCAFNIYDDDPRGSIEWGSNAGGSYPMYRTPREGIFLRYYEIGQTGETLHIEEIGEDRCADHYAYLCTLPGVGEQLLRIRDSGVSFPTSQIDHVAYYKYGYLLFITFEPAPEAHEIFKRFARVFEQTYTRFLDLKKAEAQAREAQIEAALERVRGQSMLMQHSSELVTTSSVFHEQLLALGVDSEFSYVWLPDEPNLKHQFWATWTEAENGSPVHRSKAVTYDLDKSESYTAACFAAWESDDPIHVEFVATGEVDTFFATWEELLRGAENLKPEFFRDGIHYAEAYMRYGCFGINIRRTPTDSERDIIRRFAVEFERAYTRFLDLKHAEEQAREAQIEAALERVRAKAMSMHSSSELSAVVVTVFEELTRLDFALSLCVIWIIDPDTLSTRIWMANPEHPSGAKSYFVKYHDHPTYLAYLDAWRERDPQWVHDLGGEAKASWDEFVFSETEFAELPPAVQAGMRAHPRTVMSASFNSFGALQTAGKEPLSTTNLDILSRFGRVFDLTYTRFDELQQAEARARAAEQDASLDRVRAEIASMRTTVDLERITPLISRELKTLGVPFFRCGILVADDDHERVQTFLTTPEGESLAPFFLPYDSVPTVNEAVEKWRRRQVHTGVWDRDQYVHWTGVMAAQRVLPGAAGNEGTDGFEGDDEPPESLALHFLPFEQGVLYVGSAAPLGDEALASAQALADAFAVAFARYEDFQRLEAKNREVEAAMNELRTTQAQLVQSEKMASLGQLTAGIAHEIKNPLNFVTNFAGVSQELIADLEEEEDPEERRALLADIRTNAALIEEHGRRADTIVRSMMEHARSETGERRAMDVNAFVEEFAGLAYSGRRARISDFETALEYELDAAAGTAEFVPQEIGRALINLLDNAFDAVRERSHGAGDSYAPSVRVSTHRAPNGVRISIADNGTGMTREVRDKIFEPFYTTKPTGEGTGLGLSMTYDIIVQGHGGELLVESERDRGTTFTLVLPVA